MTQLWSLRGLSWRELAKRTCRKSWEEEVFGQSARLAFYFFFALFPILLLLLILLSMSSGARTRLHADPWCSDALLCQLYGEKEFVMYDPAQAPYLTNGPRSVDVEAPDLQAFPDFPRARVTVRDVLRPGEVLLVPAGWLHHFKSTSDSISLTWNFVHRCRVSEFLSYMAAGPPELEVKQLAYAYFGSPGRRPLDASDFLAMVSGIRESRALPRD